MRLVQRIENYGGQAVIEGVMMRGREVMATAVRRDDDQIVVDRRPVAPWSKRYPVLAWPLIRGVVALVDSLAIGVQSLVFSANVAAADEDVEIKPRDMALSMILALALALVFFVALPAGIIRLVQGAVESNLLLNVLEGLIKVAIFTGYLAAIGLMPDIRRVFQYHGAEHKVINAFEGGADLSVEAVRPYSRIHPRCGTSFIFFVLLVSIFVFSFFGRPPFVQRVLIHIAILPLVAGLSYELIRASGRPKPFFLLRWLAQPGWWLQRLTTREPDDAQLEVGLRALMEVLPPEARHSYSSRPKGLHVC
ncbi:MAG: DUF1385 domain-containing protein [Firmicutes bacterium]|nr:DUF1385 domain-containing protein [Bacillota bacterium]